MECIEILVSFAKPQKKNGVYDIHYFGDSYEENFQSFFAFMALEEYPVQLTVFLNSPAAKKLPLANVNEAKKRLPEIVR